MISQISTLFSRSPRFHKQNARLKLFQESRRENYAHQIIEETTNFAGCSLSNLVDTVILTVNSTHVLRRSLYEPGTGEWWGWKVSQKTCGAVGKGDQLYFSGAFGHFPWC